jgi:hypothetical protein
VTPIVLWYETTIFGVYDKLVLILSSHSIKSEWVEQEIDITQYNGYIEER